MILDPSKYEHFLREVFLKNDKEKKDLNMNWLIG
jgi:hypothetical protein